MGAYFAAAAAVSGTVGLGEALFAGVMEGAGANSIAYLVGNFVTGRSITAGGILQAEISGGIAGGLGSALGRAAGMAAARARPFLSNKAISLTNLDEYEVRSILGSQGGWEEGMQVAPGYEGQPKWTKMIDGLNHEVRMHPGPTRLNWNIKPGMGAYEGPVSRYGVELVPGGRRFLPDNFKPDEFIPANLKPLYAMDRKLRMVYGDQPDPMKGWGLHYLDPFGFAYTDEAGKLVGVATEHGHMFGKNHP